MTEPCPAEFITLAARLADASGAVIRRYFRRRIAVDDKPDQSPVTIADRDAEAAIRDLIRSSYPQHGILGEEHGTDRVNAEWVWTVDPIDGTKAFITGKPMFGTLIGLARNGRPVLGLMDQPVTHERWIGAVGHPTLFNGDVATTRACRALDHAMLNSTSPDMFVGEDRTAFARLAGTVKHSLYGGDCIAYGLLACGFIDLVVEAGLKPWDFCALAPIVEGGGGKMTDWRSRPLQLGSDGRVVAAGDAAVHSLAVDRLGVL
jgi:inositol-phosphate phosphatase/L-galactose 1-phosphate phosphatase/histidinol-phosphatase